MISFIFFTFLDLFLTILLIDRYGIGGEVNIAAIYLYSHFGVFGMIGLKIFQVFIVFVGLSHILMKTQINIEKRIKIIYIILIFANILYISVCIWNFLQFPIS